MTKQLTIKFSSGKENPSYFFKRSKLFLSKDFELCAPMCASGGLKKVLDLLEPDFGAVESYRT